MFVDPKLPADNLDCAADLVVFLNSFRATRMISMTLAVLTMEMKRFR